MPNCLAELLNGLESEKSLYARMVRLTDDQIDALIHSQPERVSEAASRQTRTMTELSRTSERNRSALRRLAAERGWTEATTLSRAADRLPSEEAEALRRVREEILTLSDRLARNIHAGTLLLQTSLDSIRFTMTLLAGAAPKPESYAAPAPHASPLVVDSAA